MRSKEETYVHARQLIPPLTLRTLQGLTVHAWDFKQKRNLVIAFLDAGCSNCNAFVELLMRYSAALREMEAVALLVFPETSMPLLNAPSSPLVITGFDRDGRGSRAFLGEGCESPGGRVHRGVFVTDRYGELSVQWIIGEHKFPGIDEILSALNLVEIACEECSVPHWPVDD